MSGANTPVEALGSCWWGYDCDVVETYLLEVRQERFQCFLRDSGQIIMTAFAKLWICTWCDMARYRLTISSAVILVKSRIASFKVMMGASGASAMGFCGLVAVCQQIISESSV